MVPFWSFSSKVKPGHVYLGKCCLRRMFLRKNEVEELKYRWDPQIKYMFQISFSKTKPRNGNFLQTFSLKPRTRGKHSHSFIFLHGLPQSGLVVIDVPLIHICGYFSKAELYCTRKIVNYNSSILVSAGDIIGNSGSLRFFLPCNKFYILKITATYDFTGKLSSKPPYCFS